MILLTLRRNPEIMRYHFDGLVEGVKHNANALKYDATVRRLSPLTPVTSRRPCNFSRIFGIFVTRTFHTDGFLKHRIDYAF